jgi:hypothetical protein
VHVDGAYVNSHARPAIRKDDRVDRRLAQKRNPDKRCMLVIRQNHTPEERAHGYQGPSVHPVDGDPQGRPGPHRQSGAVLRRGRLDGVRR